MNYKRQNVVTTIRQNGALLISQGAVTYFTANPLTERLARYDNGTYLVYTPIASYPQSASPGQGGSVASVQYYSANGALISNASLTWTLEPIAGDANSAWLCANTSLGGAVSGCSRINRAGDIVGQKYTQQLNGEVLRCQ